MIKNDLVASSALREIRDYPKIPKKFLKIQRIDRKLRKKIGNFKNKISWGLQNS
jgi:hypothetical protein